MKLYIMIVIGLFFVSAGIRAVQCQQESNVIKGLFLLVVTIVYILMGIWGLSFIS